MSSARTTLALVGSSLVWVLLLLAQGATGPRDGVVTSVGLAHSGAWPGATWFGSGPAAGRALAVLLLLAPAALVLAGLSRPVRRPVVLAVITGLGLLSFLAGPQLSNDVFLYRLSGEMLADTGANPYRTAPDDEFMPRELRGVPWTGQPSPYGPVALGLFAATATLTPSATAQLWLLRVLLALPWAVAVLHLARRHPARVMLLGLSPLLLLEVVQSGHLDGWVGLLLAAVLLALERTDPGPLARGVVVLAWAAAVGLKLSALAVAGVVLVGLFRHPAWGVRRGLGAFGAGLALVVLAWLPLWAGPQTLEGLRLESSKVAQSLYQLLQVPPDAASAATLAGSLVAMVVGALLARRGWPLAAAATVALVLQAWLGRSFVQPWYFVPPVVLAAIAGPVPDAPAAGRAAIDPRVWGVASIGLLAGGYGPVFATYSLAPPVQATAVALMLLPGLAAYLVALRSFSAPSGREAARPGRRGRARPGRR